MIPTFTTTQQIIRHTTNSTKPYKSKKNLSTKI